MRRFLLLLLLSLVSCGGPAHLTPSPASLTPRDTAGFVADLQKDGFVVQAGSIQAVDLLAGVSEHLLPSAYGNNAGGIYFPVILPPAPGQNPAHGEPEPVGYRPGDPSNAPANPNVWPYGGNYKLRPDEAVVLITRTPPQATYFGYVGYIGLTENRPGHDYTHVYQAGDDTVGHYHRIFGSLGDTLSNRRIKTEATGEPFGQLTVMVFAADASVMLRVRRALEMAGYPGSMTNEFVLPSRLVKMGLEKGKDTFVILGRVTIWADEAAGSAYLAQLNQHSSVFRVTPTTPLAANPATVPEPIRRETGVSEDQALPGLESDLAAMRSAILARFAVPGYTYRDLETSLWIPYGFTGYPDDVDCLADNRDALYVRTDNFQFGSDDDFVVCYGPYHDVTRFSLYSDVSLYGVQYLNGVAGVTSPHFPGTAVPYLPGERSGSYYSYRLARNAAPGEACAVVPKSTGNPQGFAFGVDNDQDAFIVFRIYARPQTGVAPASSELTWDRAILFTRQP